MLVSVGSILYGGARGAEEVGTPGEVGSVTEGRVVAVSPADTPIAVKGREWFILYFFFYRGRTMKLG
jgi:hypothetical protein